MKKTTIISLVIHVGLLAGLIYFGAREIRQPRVETVAPTEIIDESEFQARLNEEAGEEVQAIDAEAENKTAEIAEPEVIEEQDSIEALRQRIAEEMRRREEERLAITDPIVVEPIETSAEPVVTQTQTSSPQTAPTVPPIGASAPRTATLPPSRSADADSSSVSQDEIDLLLEQVTVTEAVAEVVAEGVASIIPPARDGATPENIQSAEQGSPSQSGSASSTEQVQQIEVASALAPESAIVPPSRGAFVEEQNIDNLVETVVQEAEVEDQQVDELVELAQIEVSTESNLAPQEAIRPPSR